MAVADLIYNIAGDSSRFVRALQQADRELQRTTANMSGFAKAGAFVTAGLGAAAAALGELSRQALTDMVEIQRAADRVGMSAEQMSKLEYAAKLSGIQFDELADAVQEFNLKIGEARTGDQASIDAFNQLGVAINSAGGALRPAGDVLNDVIDALAKVPDKATQSALAAKVLGEEAGIKLTPLLAKGAGALKEMGEEAEQIGFAFSDEAGTSAVQFQENLTRLQGVSEGLGRQMVQVFTPALSSLTKEMLENSKGATEMRARQEAAFELMRGGLIVVTSLGIAFKILSLSFAGLGAMIAVEFEIAFESMTGFLSVLNRIPIAARVLIPGLGVLGSIGDIAAVVDPNVARQSDIGRARAEALRKEIAASYESASSGYLASLDRLMNMKLELPVVDKPAAQQTGQTLGENIRLGAKSEIDKISQDMQRAADRIVDGLLTADERAANQFKELDALVAGEFLSVDVATKRARQIEAERDRSANEAMRALMDRGREVRESLLTDAQILETRAAELRGLFYADIIDEETFTKGIQSLGGDVTKSAMTAVEQIRAEHEKLKALLDAEAISAETFAAAMRNLAGDDILTDVQRTQAELDKLNELLKLGAISAAEYDVALNKLFAKTPAKLTEAQNFGVDAAKALQSSFSAFLFDPFNVGLEGMVKGFASAMARIVAELLAKKAVLAILGAGGAGPELLAAVGGATFAEGGYVSGPGTSTSDSIPARLSNGEYVMPANTVRHFGVDFMDAIRAMRPAREAPVARFAEGGYVNQQASSGGGVRVVNVVDSSMVQDFLTSSAGEQVILNTIRRNRRQVSQVMG